ncbi:HlyD family efflux transporter periplasmic adaptor subunit [Oleiharenicola lentus]|jgi:HlyD family secretion protein|uniref:HlyD family efflux transporter periplasmic adaptor subunit n=1 Tax=Oleiharenicola lentus TaxID=2508720 RepID=A0A4Q1C7L7_9BACT|nr:HlyD family efflux transporter periplasmic adaptor subunit [Oleiharenicola lentus]RXK54816.1 HlyD family efflux transporter periplasmic adaptor subunit [Oleiharenicola lentus]
MKNSSLAKVALGAISLLSLVACSRRESSVYQGYLEGEFVHLAAPLAGRLEKLTVSKGTRVTAGTPLFQLEQGAESAALGEAAGRLRAAQARLADLRKGQRPSELAALEARLEQTRAAAELATRELERLTRLHETKVASEDDFDRARLNQEAAVKQVAELFAQLETARLGARSDLITAAEAEAAAAQAALDRAGWSIAQKNVTAPRDGLIYDTLYREGEFVAAALPVVTLLPPENIKVRFFVPEAAFGGIKAGDRVQVVITGRASPLDARITYLSPQPEYTPPILYNRENRSKLVFMVEATFDAAVARDLHPGQPVEVTTAK